MSILALNNVAYQYDGTQKNVLQNVTMQFENENIYAIVGNSGSGKTTLLSLLAGLDVCTKGEILFNGKSLSELNRNHYRARSVGVVFQGLNLLLNATAVENLVLSMQISGVSEKDKKTRAYELLNKVGIGKEKADRKVLQLSGGEQQRIGIARALSHNPQVIIADEPTGNLDSKTEQAVFQIFDKLAHEDGKCVIIVTHSKKVAACADEIWGVTKGVFQQIPTHKHK